MMTEEWTYAPGTRLRRRGVFVLLWCFVLFALSTATVATGAVTPRGSRNLAARSSRDGLFELDEASFTMRASNGYRITVVGFLGGHHSVTLYAERGHSGVEYTVPGRVTETEIDATFGSVGSVALHFEPSGSVREAVDYCDSTHPTVAVKLGTFVGSISFHGERAYTSVTGSRAEGGVGNSLALPGNRENRQCRAVSSGGEVVQKAEFASLEASASKTHLHFTAIAITKLEGGDASAVIPRVFVAAGSVTREERMTISRFVGSEAPRMAFKFDDALDSATVTPPAPFSGTARFRNDSDGTSFWTGSLKAPVPGLGRVRLAGPGFHARFGQTSGTVIH